MVCCCLDLKGNLFDFDHITSGFDFAAFIEESVQKKPDAEDPFVVWAVSGFFIIKCEKCISEKSNTSKSIKFQEICVLPAEHSDECCGIVENKVIAFQLFFFGSCSLPTYICFLWFLHK